MAATSSPGTVYPNLRELERSGYLARGDRVVQGKACKCYRTTPRGDETSAEARAKLAELVPEVLRMERARALAGEEDPQA